MVRDPLTADLDQRQQALARYALKLTLKPHAMTQNDVEKLRKAGLDNRAIHDAAQVIAYFNYVNRIADGLGVDLEQEAPIYRRALEGLEPGPPPTLPRD